VKQVTAIVLVSHQHYPDYNLVGQYRGKRSPDVTKIADRNGYQWPSRS